ncbi:MAG TPA: transglutaminase family protein, partial [Acidimicrobiales bacterium]|nr:transglutaminase family protein [Acidimicrobiales bacterium]
IHLVDAPAGPLTIRYDGDAPSIVPMPVTDDERVVYTRQSRYCPSDVLEGFARTTFGAGTDPGTIGDWVHDRLTYVSGSSDSYDTAIETLLTGRGVCRDFAHLTVALCRASGVPARLVAVYAPWLEPMDFHAVAEAEVDGAWQVVDATRLAPTEMLVRICHGRDAADTAFVSTLRGDASLRRSTVHASV